jgi:hypothetical protein
MYLRKKIISRYKEITTGCFGKKRKKYPEHLEEIN